MNAEQIAALALDAGEGVASILAAVPDPAVRAGGTIAVGLIKAIRALSSSMGPEKAAAVIRAMAETSHAISPEDLAADDAELGAKVRKLIAERDGAQVAAKRITINGRVQDVRADFLDYGQVLSLAGYKGEPRPGLTVTWRSKSSAGELVSVGRMLVSDGLIINVADTSRA